MTRRWRCALLLAGTLAMPACDAADAETAAVVEQPRAFGHVVGDLLTQRVLLAADRPLAAASMPAAQRLTVWLERRAGRIERSPDGQRWLVVDYQLVNAPQSQASVRIPAWRLAGDAGRPALLVPAWPVSVSAITERAAPGSVDWPLRPDRPAPAIAMAPLRLRLVLASTALAACLAAWAGWLAWSRWRDAATQPFSSAWRVLGRADDRPAAAWRALHEAFDRSAGEVLRPATLPRLFERAPHFEPQRARIEAFYAQSAARFFGEARGADASDVASLRTLCRDLRGVERRSLR